ncbi:MAG: hypothetical protein QOF89_5791 [Acidobacteriota bacterium]|jgi:hypothetical protein|nr:hypothetical protein [Acidobacteriota bacterium]
MKKKMERLDDELFRPLTFAEHKRIRGASGNVTTTTAITLLVTETEDSSPDYTHDGDTNE